MGRYGNVYPIGSSQGQVNVAGRTWELFYGLNGSMKVYSFVASSPVNSFSANVKDFFTYLANSKGYPASSQYLISMPSLSPENKIGCTDTNEFLKPTNSVPSLSQEARRH